MPRAAFWGSPGRCMDPAACPLPRGPPNFALHPALSVFPPRTVAQAPPQAAGSGAGSAAGPGARQPNQRQHCPPPRPLQIAEVPKPEFMAKTLEELQIGTYSNIAVVRTSTPIYVALGIFVQHRVSALPVVDDSGKDGARRWAQRAPGVPKPPARGPRPSGVTTGGSHSPFPPQGGWWISIPNSTLS